MPYKTVLCHLLDDSRDTARMQAALSFAGRTEAHVVGLFVIEPLNESGGALLQVPASVYDSYYARCQASAEALGARFAEAARRQAVSAEWRVMRGFQRDALKTSAIYADLVVMGAPETQASIMDGNSDLAADVALQTGRPVAYLPSRGEFALTGKRVLLAWNGSRESARAMADALDILKGADNVSVITAGLEGAAPAMDISTVLARHGVKVETRNIQAAADTSLGDMLLQEAARRNCDLMVMGIYGHSRMNEWVFGGVSRHILRHATLPILFSH